MPVVILLCATPFGRLITIQARVVGFGMAACREGCAGPLLAKPRNGLVSSAYSCSRTLQEQNMQKYQKGEKGNCQ